MSLTFDIKDSEGGCPFSYETQRSSSQVPTSSTRRMISPLCRSAPIGISNWRIDEFCGLLLKGFFEDRDFRLGHVCPHLPPTACRTVLILCRQIRDLRCSYEIVSDIVTNIPVEGRRIFCDISEHGNAGEDAPMEYLPFQIFLLRECVASYFFKCSSQGP